MFKRNLIPLFKSTTSCRREHQFCSLACNNPLAGGDTSDTNSDTNSDALQRSVEAHEVQCRDHYIL